ncbi:lactonase family protein [Vibrio ziniensis]|uniref:Lactonase family protein n=1 Tax=Vibrio ziniensis TaxID=2711221 RepID=A0A6G7CQM2_9VIBR|nr:beta-propeller fold lactonase family protein [Vibrio ziniensis]QIH44451.1 lactonase family protein [Vibrio ziniensis]
MTQFVYLSNALSGTISRYRFQQGVLSLLGETEVGFMVMPMTISPCHNYLYAAVRSEPFRIVQFGIDLLTGDLSIVRESLVNESIVTLSTDNSDQWLLAASFNQHRVSITALDDLGQLTDQTTAIQHNGPCHMFRFSPENKWMVATAFGQDKLHVYPRPNNDASVGMPVFSYDFPQNSGPRHFTFSSCGSVLYVLTEMSATITTFEFNADNGSLIYVAETSVLPLNTLGLKQGLPPAQRVANDVARVWAADIHVTHNGRFLYVSERTLSVIACFEIADESPVPQYLRYQEVERQPRSFMITDDDQHMLVTGELANEVSAYSLDASSGSLTKVSSAPCGEGAAWVCMMA